ncbi:hypothetical protein OIO90_005873 [Microbotryomycetes sp. JL221]|nr:hypothetical protein OIO90_005873 [Microbotryomycetes sp. JL221]
MASTTRSRNGAATPSQRATTTVTTATEGRSTPTSSLRRTAEPVLTLSTPHLQSLATILLCTCILGTVVSVFYVRPEVTALRSRMPAAQLTRWDLGKKIQQSSDQHFPLPTLPYFADKRNVINQLFVKYAWAWTTVAFLVHSVAMHLSTYEAPATSQARISLSGPTRFSILMVNVRRYILATLYWYYLTQRSWFGMSYPSVTRYILMKSGATCVPSSLSSTDATTTDTSNNFDDLASTLTEDGPLGSTEFGRACTGQRGEFWRGGHDVSGHTFMMVHSSLFLYQLIAPTLPIVFPSLYKKSFSDKSRGTTTTFEPQHGPAPLLVKLSTYFVIALMAVWWWMLLMTSLFFHSPAEKMSGFMFAIAGWFVSNL